MTQPIANFNSVAKNPSQLKTVQEWLAHPGAEIFKACLISDILTSTNRHPNAEVVLGIDAGLKGVVLALDSRAFTEAMNNDKAPIVPTFSGE